MMNHNYKLFLIGLILLLALSFANSTILINTSTDKRVLSENEIALLTIKMLNDSEKELTNVQLRLQADEGIKFAEGEDKSFTYKQIEKINPMEAIELKIKIKCVTREEKKINIYTYYGVEEPQNSASVVFVESINLPIEVITSIEQTDLDGSNKIITNYKLVNRYDRSIYRVGAEVLAPHPLQVETEPTLKEVLIDGDEIESTFVVTAPIETQGEFDLIIAYGFVDSNTPHYFEKLVSVKYTKPNYELIGLIGLVILIIAAYLFLRKGDEPQSIKGTSIEEEEN